MTTNRNNPEANTKATEQTPIERFLSLVPAKSYSRGYLACCPAHGERNASLMIWEDETDRHVGLKCFVGCERAAICEAVGLTESDLYVTKGRHYKPASPARRLDLLDLAVHKLIHPNLLFSLQISDGYTWTTSKGKQIKNVVRIPYFTEDGQEHPRARIRTALSAKDGSYWDGPDTIPPIPYGLWKLQEARDAGYLWIVEGESDCWTNWQHQLPALGIPGATNVGKLEAAHLRDIPILYIVQEPTEPGKKMDAGKVFVTALQRRLSQTGYQGQVYIISLQSSHGVKDPNALHQQLTTARRFKDYPNELQQAIHEAVPLVMDAACDALPEESIEVLQPLVESAIEKQDTNTLYDLAPRFARLDTGERAKLLTPVKQGMGKQSGFSLQMLNMLIREARSDLERVLRGERVRVSKKPDIILGRQQDEEVDDILDALYKANSPPVLFVRGGRLARCRCNEKGKPVIDPVDEYMLLDRMARVANFMTYSSKSDDYTDAHPPVSLARVILAKGEWNFPALEGITEVPVIRPDGTVLDIPGYDQTTHLIYIPQQDIDIPKVPDAPTPEEVQRARDFAWSFFAEFPYASRADAANAFALLLTPVTRSLYELVPLALVDSTKQGTGKGLLSKGVSVVGTGRSCASITQPETEDEWAKTLTSLLMEGNTIISIDNVERILSSPKLSSFLTSDYWKHRLLGTNHTPELLQRSIVMANGNNLQLGKDIPRRSYRIRMDAGTSQPWKRKGFTYSPLLEHIKKSRGKIIAALLTMVRAWYAAGKPAPQEEITTLGEFSEWATIIGGILAYAGVQGFLANTDELYEEADVDGTAWAAFLEAWYEKLGTEAYTVAEILAKLEADAEFAATLPDGLATLQLEQSKSFRIRLGKTLLKHNGTPFGKADLRIKKTMQKHTKQNTWQVMLGSSGLPAWQKHLFTPLAPVSQEIRESHDEAHLQPARPKRTSAGEPGPTEKTMAAAPAPTLVAATPAPAWCRNHPHTRGLHVDSTGQRWCDKLECWDCYRLLMLGQALGYHALPEAGIAEGLDAWQAFVGAHQKGVGITLAVEKALITIRQFGIPEPDLATLRERVLHGQASA